MHTHTHIQQYLVKSLTNSLKGLEFKNFRNNQVHENHRPITWFYQVDLYIVRAYILANRTNE